MIDVITGMIIAIPIASRNAPMSIITISRPTFAFCFPLSMRLIFLIISIYVSFSGSARSCGARKDLRSGP